MNIHVHVRVAMSVKILPRSNPNPVQLPPRCFLYERRSDHFGAKTVGLSDFSARPRDEGTRDPMLGSLESVLGHPFACILGQVYLASLIRSSDNLINILPARTTHPYKSISSLDPLFHRARWCSSRRTPLFIKSRCTKRDVRVLAKVHAAVDLS